MLLKMIKEALSALLTACGPMAGSGAARKIFPYHTAALPINRGSRYLKKTPK